MDKGRRKPDKREDSPLVQAAKEEVLPGYEEYLVLLQERNRLLKRLRKKSKKDIEQERREQGFSLYVNGPHKDGKPAAKSPGQPVTIPTQPASRTARKPKTAGERPRNNNVLDNQALQKIAKEEIERQKEMARAKTAPSARERRRNWKVDSSVEIRTTQGGAKIKPPEILSGRYADDFESGDDSDELRSSASECSADYSSPNKQQQPIRKPPPPRESDMFNSSDSINSGDDGLDQDSEGEDLVVDASKFSKLSNSSPRKSQKSLSKNSNSDDDDFGQGEKLMLSMRELRTLRQSLVRNATIRESMARDKNSDDEFIPESPIQEVEEDLPSDKEDVYEDSPDRKINLNKPTMKPDDTIVLEFGRAGGSASNKKVEKNLSAARKKDYDDGEYSGSSRGGMQRPGSAKSARDPLMLSARSQSTKTLGSENTGKKSVRPLSANRRTPDKVWTDPDTEASAVMAALKAENEQASKLKQTPKPRSSPQTKSTRESQSKLQFDKSEMRPKTHQAKVAESSQSSVSMSQNEPLVPLDKINQIMEKVLRMSPRHQRRLVSMLGKIEKSIVTESTENVSVASSNKNRSSNSGPMKAVHPSVNKKSPSSSTGDVIELHIEIKSNWGHAMRLGLTEIQIYNQSGSLVPISAADVTIHGAEDCKGTVDLLFNGKFKTNKDRNMWSCRYHARRPVEIIINVRNPETAGKSFSLSQMKIWNYNKSIADLDIGIKDAKIFVGADLVYNGTVEKGCGNQVFDYGHVIPLVPQASHRSECNLEVEVESSRSPEEPVPRKPKLAPSRSLEKISRKSALEDRGKKNSLAKSRSPDSLDQRPPVSPRNERSPSPAPVPKLRVNQSPRESVSANHRSISPKPNKDTKKTFRSISMSSQSSASSGGESAPNSRPTSGISTPHNRSETRVLNHPSMGKNVPYSSQGSDSFSDNEDGSKGTPAKQRGVKTPRKSKRMAARLDGHTSTEVESSKSVSESVEKRPQPPLPPRKSEEKMNRKALVQKSLEDKSKAKPDTNEKTKCGSKVNKKDEQINEQKVVADLAKKQETEMEDTLKAGGTVTVSSSVSVASSQDDTPMLQKLKDMNKKDQSNPRKKDMPKWLKQEDLTTPFENPPESRDGSRPEPAKPAKSKPPPTQEEINMLIDEEMSLFPEEKKSAPEPELAMEVSEPDGTPMQRIQKNRSKWRENPSMNLEESWGSLSQFNKCQRGRLSLDMDDDVLDEYINKAAKLAGLATEPAIPEEEFTSDSPSNMNIDSDDEGFVIPELPYGKELVLNIRSTWGDKHYVGLTSIEVFSSTGEQVTISKIFAEPSDINILPEYDKDPRVVKNLIDGHNRTRDDIHMWLAPFTSGKDHLVCCAFDKPCKVALVRIWVRRLL